MPVEAIDIAVGLVSDAAMLPSHRHSGIGIDTNNTLVLRLQKRKRRLFLNIIRKILIQLNVEHATAFTLKAFRAGKVTALASSGASLGQILEARDWRGRAVLNYVNEDVFDGAQLVARELELSDCE